MIKKLLAKFHKKQCCCGICVVEKPKKTLKKVVKATKKVVKKVSKKLK